ncbi:MAG TPA: ABC transporter substrate-binding protein [Methylomirabilota bacterium]|jgi:branched-chain amino acid transport system substrate-binding protein|nr:ABC transporter substrate-binding protein [Methylomirabilota bacterium]
MGRGQGIGRRSFVTGAGAAAGLSAIGFPAVLRAQPPTVKIGVVHPVTGPLAEPGQACRAGAQMGAEEINAAGGIKALGGARLELLLGDTQSKPDVARPEAERLVNGGAQVLMGAFSSGDSAAIVPVAQQRQIPFLIDISAADPITANVAKSVKDGQQKLQYVYRNFPTGSMFGQRAVQFMSELFKEAGIAPKRVVLMYANDLFGQVQARSFQAAHKAAGPPWDIVEVIPWPEPPSDLSTEVARLRAAKPDIIAPITRPASALLLLPEIARQRVDAMGIIGPGSPGLYEAGQIEKLKGDLELVMDNVPWPNFKNPRARRVAEEYAKRTGGKTLDTNSVFSYDGIHILADVLERSRSTKSEAVVEAIKRTRFTGNLAVSVGPVVFNEIGDNPNASSAMIQILGQKPAVVWPKDSAEQKFVLPRPKR